jgi:O-succinylbenzoic acid--CoA ligase
MVIARWAQDRSSEVTWLQKNLPDLPRHVWLATSGTLATPGASQWIAISKEALLVNAASVNQHLSAQSHEKWGLALPLAHVGGLGILARAQLLGQKVVGLVQAGWEPQSIADGAWDGELLSLVPTQVHDLVRLRLSPPPSLRAVVVGGDRLTDELYQQGRELGWPLLPSYGLTECGSQIATATEGQADLRLLSHVNATTDREDRLWLESAALYTGKIEVLSTKLTWHPRPEGAWATQDRAEIHGGRLTILGRLDHVVKVRGEKVDLSALEAELQERCNTTLIIISLTDERDGAALWVVSENPLSLEALNQRLLPHQKIRGVHQVESFPRTSLGKIRRGEIKALLER